jgi:hypothetical protein
LGGGLNKEQDPVSSTGQTGTVLSSANLQNGKRTKLTFEQGRRSMSKITQRIMIEELESQLGAIIGDARTLARSSEGICRGQIEAYFIPWMEHFKEDVTQPGSLASIRRILGLE